jgi:hypothetical protein
LINASILAPWITGSEVSTDESISSIKPSSAARRWFSFANVCRITDFLWMSSVALGKSAYIASMDRSTGVGSAG